MVGKEFTMKLHSNWCEKSWDGLHCFHILKSEDKKSQPTEEKCCWCSKKQFIYFITGSSVKPHGKGVNNKELLFPMDDSWDTYHQNNRREWNK